MKLFLFAITALLTLANIATAARALSSNKAVLATVPFNFTVGHDQLPSGTYTISRDPWGLVTMKAWTGALLYPLRRHLKQMCRRATSLSFAGTEIAISWVKSPRQPSVRSFQYRNWRRR